MTRREFERIVEEAVEGLPAAFRDRLENVEFHVMESPNRRQSRDVGDPSGRAPSLYGLYEGTSLADRSTSDPYTLPSRITIFKRAIERDCRTRPDMIKCIQETVLHEIGHHFGFDDDQLDDLGIG